MSHALILSSHVAASRVGGTAQAIVLARLGFEPVLVPTVLFGRHPGLGPPGGGAVDPEVFSGMLEGVAARGLASRTGLVITGYFVHPQQVLAAAEALDALRAASGKPLVLVDPVLGDDGKGLYVKPGVAEAVAAELLPRADLITPNLWELGHLTGLPVDSHDAALAAATVLRQRLAGRRVVVTSAPAEAGRATVLDVSDAGVWRFSHGRVARAPNGVGDLFAALLGGALADPSGPLAGEGAVRRAVGGVADALDAAVAHGRDDLEMAGADVDLRAPLAPVIVETLGRVAGRGPS
jgi:pyridoxine kinase